MATDGTGSGKMSAMQKEGKSEFSNQVSNHLGFTAIFPKNSEQTWFEKDGGKVGGAEMHHYCYGEARKSLRPNSMEWNPGQITHVEIAQLKQPSRFKCGSF